MSRWGQRLPTPPFGAALPHRISRLRRGSSLDILVSVPGPEDHRPLRLLRLGQEPSLPEDPHPLRPGVVRPVVMAEGLHRQISPPALQDPPDLR